MTALEESAEALKIPVTFRAHERSVLAGAVGAALWGAFRARRLARETARVGAETA